MTSFGFIAAGFVLELFLEFPARKQQLLCWSPGNLMATTTRLQDVLAPGQEIAPANIVIFTLRYNY